MPRGAFKNTLDMKTSLLARAAELKREAERIGPCDAQARLVRDAEQCELAAAMDGYLGSRELEPPR